MSWLPFEDKIANTSEQLVCPTYHEEYRVKLPFTRETWNGRMKACRGVGASLTPETFTVTHYIAVSEFCRKKME